ncbi:DUF937 domain-containing protein [Methylopila turkensis]|uniref:DUF937 domain-containing protein n=1 Tax=Methylopila turkensis TaxID=1437816 RepID=A0A9W6JLX7_9HYPH|nr:DUF937 domain-containing protein [Methylopila turkensis]GLK78569.1 hypothetical protein GCM10008174_03100 [Methylopila turkensis]
MINFYELMRQAQGGAAFDNIARAYGLDPAQMRAATAALTPAFAQSFQRQARNDHAAHRLNELFGADVYARAFEAHAAALDPTARAAGDDALGALFGSKEVSRAVAAQAAAASGVQAEIIRKVLPVLTSILIGGFMKASQGASAPSPSSGGAAGPFGPFWDQMFGQTAAEGRKGGSENPQNPFQDWMGGFGKTAEEPEPRDPPANPMGDVMADILNGMFGAPRRDETSPPDAPPAEAPPAGAPEGEQSDAFAASFDQMVQTGRELQAQNARAMEQIFEAFLGAGKKPG